VNEAKTSINNTILSYKPDLSSVTQEIRSLLKSQEDKIGAQKVRINTLTNLVNSQGTKIEELKNLVKDLPTMSPTPSSSFTPEDRKMLTDHSSILTSQAGFMKSICDTLEQLLTASRVQPLQTSSLAVAEGRKVKMLLLLLLKNLLLPAFLLQR